MHKPVSQHVDDGPSHWSTADPDLLRSLASCPQLLVATDYDGTLSPLVDDPSQAVPCDQCVVALRELSELPQTEVAVISGRSLAQLGEFLGHLERVHLVGSHGSEFDLDFVNSLTHDQQECLAFAESLVADAVKKVPNSSIERKPASVCFHYRTAQQPLGEQVSQHIESQARDMDGVFVKHGKSVIELSVAQDDKGSALSLLRSRLGPTCCVFLGDDRTDEDAFAVLDKGDLGMKVGSGISSADYAVADPAEVSQFLAALAEERAAWLGGGGGAVPIERHSMLSNRQTIALLEPDATISWMCAPRIDSPAIFASLIGGPRAGRWSIRPHSAGAPTVQHYHPNSLTVVTEQEDVRITDFLDCTDSQNESQAGNLALVRLVQAEQPVSIEFAPRLNYGRTPTRIVQVPGGLQITGSHHGIYLDSPNVSWNIVRYGEHDTAYAQVKPVNQSLALVLRYAASFRDPPASDPQDRLQATNEIWAVWARSLHLPELHQHAVLRSALTLKALTYESTGAIAAAGTTSLPEWIGGVRNWDYRYCWPRDAAMAACSLLRLGSHSEATSLLNWLAGVITRSASPESLAPIYTVNGEEVPHEAVVTELSGYAGSRPVRVGNAASVQVQLDVFAPIVTLIAMLAERSHVISHWYIRLAHDLALAVTRRWQEPDHGIWEPRTPPRHNTHTKVMCWLTLDRAIRISECAERVSQFNDFRPVRDAICQDILTHGWSESLGSFSATYESPELDAATLWVGLSGMLDPEDHRFVSTVCRIEESLRVDATVYRYFHEDGLPGNEGGFHLCTAWLIQALTLIGERGRARAILDDYVRLSGPTGLMSEEYDPRSGKSLGNFPQAYSHLGLIDAVLSLDPSNE